MLGTTWIYSGLLRTVIESVPVQAGRSIGFWNQISWPSIDCCFEQMCRQSRTGPAAAGRWAGPARTRLLASPARRRLRGMFCPAATVTAGYVDQTAQAAAWPAAPEGLDKWPCQAQDVTASAHLHLEGCATMIS